MRKMIRNFEDLWDTLPAIYSPSSVVVMRSALNRAVRMTRSASLRQLTADVVAWEDEAARIVWCGEFRAPTPEKAKRNFDTFVARITGIIKRAHAHAEGEGRPDASGSSAGWDEFCAYVHSVKGKRDGDGALLLSSLAHVSAATLRNRLGHIPLPDLRTEHFLDALSHAPAGKHDSIRRAASMLNRWLIDRREAHGPIARLLPQERIGALPLMRDLPVDWSAFSSSFIRSRDEAIEAAMAAPRPVRRDSFGGRLGRPALRGDARVARGKTRRVRNKERRRITHLAALSWLVRHGDLRTDAASLNDIRDLVTYESAECAVQSFVERTRKSKVMKSAADASSATTYLSTLGVLVRRGLGDPDLAADIEDLKYEEDLETHADREMSASRAAFVRLIEYDRRVAGTIVMAAETLYREANRRLKQWSQLGTNKRIGTLHLLAAAALWALQIGRPLRTRNLNELTIGGDNPQINKPRSGEDDPFLAIRKEMVKNRRPIENRIHPHYWRIVKTWLEKGRPLYIKISKKRDFSDNNYLFPGSNGPIARATLNKIWNRGVELLGLQGLTPHMMRHCVATLHLAVHPGDYAVVAALLCDKQRTVEKFYSRGGGGHHAAELFRVTLEQAHPELHDFMRKAA